MCASARAAPALLAHLNLLITVYGGAALSTAARLKWDPSTYVAVREVFPAEYRAACAALTAAGIAALLLPHLCAAALHCAAPASRRRAALLYLYAALLAVLMVAELSFSVWLTERAIAWLRSEDAARLGEALELRNHLRPVLQFFARWHPLPRHIDELIEEAEQDAPRNVYCALVAGALLALLQALALLCALLAARCAPHATRSQSLLPLHRASPPPYSGYRPVSTTPTTPTTPTTTRRLRTAYKNGRLVIL